MCSTGSSISINSDHLVVCRWWTSHKSNVCNSSMLQMETTACWLDSTYALSLPVDHRPQTTRLHPALSWATTSIFLQLYLKLAIHISFSKSLLQVFLGCPLLRPCDIDCSACLLMLSSLLLSVCPSQFRFRPLSFSCTAFLQVFFFLSSLLDILSSQRVFAIFRRHLLIKTSNMPNVLCIIVQDSDMRSRRTSN